MDNKPSRQETRNITSFYEQQIETLKYVEKINYTLYDISNAINSTHTLEELYQSIYDSLNKLIPLPNFFIAIYDNKNKAINFEFFIDEYDDDFPIIENLKEPNCLTGEVILARRPLFLKENMLLERAKKNKIAGTLPKIWIGVPLIIQDKVIGAICVQNYTDPNYFSHKHLEMLISVSDLIALAIERQQMISALKKREKTLQDSKERVNLIFDALPGAIIITHFKTGKITDANKSFIELSGINKNEIIGKTATEIGIWRNETHRLAFVSRIKEKGYYENFECTIFLNTKKIPILFSSRLLFIEGILHIVSIIHDISNKKVHEEHLFQRLGMDSIETHANGIAHDFNTHLSEVMGSLELLNMDQENFSENQKNHIANALTSSKKAATFIRQLRTVTKSKTSDPSRIDVCKAEADVFNIFEHKTTSQIQKRNELSPPRGSGTILVIEDEDKVRTMAVKMLRSFGYKTLEACDGEAGLHIFKKNHHIIDAVLLDIIMPKMSGIETFKQLLEIDPTAKIIISSGHITNQDQKRLFAKASAYLDKPYQMTELKQTLQSIFA